MKKHILIFIFILFLGSFLRLYNLDKVPVSLFGDEVDVGYHAYSIFKTGQDYSGNTLPLHFQSLAEWRTPLYLYSAVPTVAVFGITPWGVRLPAAVFGILCIWGIYLLTKILFKNLSPKVDTNIALLASLFLAISPWAIQYSRAGFEVTQLLFFLIFGLYFFFRSLETKGKWLWLSAAFLVATPWVYSTAKLFIPFLLIFLVLVWGKQMLKFSRKYVVFALIALFIVGAPIGYSTVFGGGTERFNYVSVFADPTIESEIGDARGIDSFNRGGELIGTKPSISDKIFHNKLVFWNEAVTKNILQSLSLEFLFNSGDPNPRHSVNGMGMFYKVDMILVLFGLGWLIFRSKENKIKLLFGFWILAGVIPSAITRDGGDHATRLILILPPLIILIAYGLTNFVNIFSNKLIKKVILIGYFGLLLLEFVFYQHTYWVHSPYDSEKFWHYGWQQALEAIKQNEDNFGKVVITTFDEPPWIFFAGNYPYDPDKWHKGYPFQKTELDNFGQVSYIDKYYFGSPMGGVGIYELGKVLDKDTLYLASAKESNVNLFKEPERTPTDLNLIKAISFPSGEAAFYLFSKK